MALQQLGDEQEETIFVVIRVEGFYEETQRSFIMVCAARPIEDEATSNPSDDQTITDTSGIPTDIVEFVDMLSSGESTGSSDQQSSTDGAEELSNKKD